MNGQPQVRLPMRPLIEAAGVEDSRTSRESGEQPNPLAALSRAIDRPTGTIHRWIREGIPIHSADEAAIRIGLHPSNIWPDWTSYAFEQDRLEDAWREAKYDAAARAWLRKRGRLVGVRRELVVGYQRVERHLRVVA